VHPIDTVDDLSYGFRQTYSRMKYSDPLAVMQAAHWLTAEILHNPFIAELVANGESLAVTSSAFGAVPTASYAVMRECATLLGENGVCIEKFKVERHGDFETTTYGDMCKVDRLLRMQSRKISINEENQSIVKDRVVIVIDDIYVTGSHEAALRKVLCATEAKTIIFCYLVQFSDKLAKENPMAEEAINKTAVESVLDLVPFFSHSNTIVKTRINARTIKFILNTETDKVVSRVEKLRKLRLFIETIDNDVLLVLYRAAVSSDRYCYNAKFVEGFSVLSAHMLARRLISVMEYNRARNATVLYNVGKNKGGAFVDMKTGEVLDHV